MASWMDTWSPSHQGPGAVLMNIVQKIKKKQRRWQLFFASASTLDIFNLQSQALSLVEHQQMLQLTDKKAAEHVALECKSLQAGGKSFGRPSSLNDSVLISNI